MIRGLSDYSPDSEQPIDGRKRDHGSLASQRGERSAVPGDGDDRSSSPRRAPRVSVVVVLPENQAFSPASLTSLAKLKDQDVDVVVACAGQPSDLTALQSHVRGAQFILAPAGTSPEDLRELAMRQAAGDIVTLVSGSRLTETTVSRQKLFRSS